MILSIPFQNQPLLTGKVHFSFFWLLVPLFKFEISIIFLFKCPSNEPWWCRSRNKVNSRKEQILSECLLCFWSCMKSNEIEHASCEKMLSSFGTLACDKNGRILRQLTGVCHKYITWNTALQWMWNMSWVFCFSLWRMYSASGGVVTSVSRQHRPGATQSAWCWRCYIKQTLHTSAAWWVPVVWCCLPCFAMEF